LRAQRSNLSFTHGKRWLTQKERLFRCARKDNRTERELQYSRYSLVLVMTLKTTAPPEQHLTSSAMLQDIVIGLSDGLTVPFALAAGLSGAVQSSGLVITAGLAEIVAGSIAMGLGGYLAGRTEVDHYAAELAREHEEVRTVPDTERQEVQELLREMGLSEATAAQATAELVQDPAQWVKFMMKYELGLEEPDPKQAFKSAFTIAGAYAVGGLIPLSAYFLTATPEQGLLWSGVITLACLLVFGFFKSRMTGQAPVAGALKMAATGAAAAAAAFYVARLVQGHGG
jgi:VIT1/CCC1 family predicted Fe2+/Mn2+ transporter